MPTTNSLPDQILDIDDLIEARSPLLEHISSIGSYRDYLESIFWHRQRSPLADNRRFPDGSETNFQHRESAFVDKGTWRWQCRACGNVYLVSRDNPWGCCVACLWPRDTWASIVLPDNMERIEALLLRLPGHRENNFLRDWRPGWTEDFLQARIDKAEAKRVAGGDLRRLSIAPSRTVAIGEIVEASYFNINVKEPLDDIAGDNGPVGFRHGIAPHSFTTVDRDAIASPPAGIILHNSDNDILEYHNGAAYHGIVDTERYILTEELLNELLMTSIAQHLTDQTHLLPPGVPTGFQLQSQIPSPDQNQWGSATFTWTMPATGGPPDSYDFQFRDTGLLDWNLIETVTSPYTRGFPPGVRFDVRVRAKNAAGFSLWTDVLVFSKT